MLYRPPATRSGPAVRIALALAIAVVCYQLYTLAFEIYKDSQIDIQYQQILSDNRALQQQRDDLQRQIAYLQTPGYREKEEKKIANMVKPGEKTLIIDRPAGTNGSVSASAEEDTWAAMTNPARWWQYMFGDEEPGTRPLDL